MAEKRVQKWLAAILAADVAGYSQLMGADEEGTSMTVMSGLIVESRFRAALPNGQSFVALRLKIETGQRNRPGMPILFVLRVFA